MQESIKFEEFLNEQDENEEMGIYELLRQADDLDKGVKNLYLENIRI